MMKNKKNYNIFVHFFLIILVHQFNISLNTLFLNTLLNLFSYLCQVPSWQHF